MQPAMTESQPEGVQVWNKLTRSGRERAVGTWVLNAIRRGTTLNLLDFVSELVKTLGHTIMYSHRIIRILPNVLVITLLLPALRMDVVTSHGRLYKNA
jgi:hypothetical protein